MLHTEPLQHQDAAVAQRMHAVLVLAHEQEAALLQASRGGEQAQSPEEIQRSAGIYIGALRGGQLLGWVGLGADDEPRQINVAALVVHPLHQRQGIARALMQHVLRQADGVVLSVVAAARNLPALALYQQLGFAEYRRGSLGDEALEVIKLRTRSSPPADAMHGYPNRDR